MILTESLQARICELGNRSARLTAEAARRVEPSAEGRPMGSGFATFAGEGSPFTQVSGYGLKGSQFDLSELEAFYAGRAQNWELIVSPLTDPALLAQAAEAGYHPHHFESTLVQTIAETPERSEIQVIETGPADPVWMRTVAQGFIGNDDLPEAPDEISRTMATIEGGRYFVAWIEGEPAGAAGMIDSKDAVSLSGASTRVGFRGRGVQQALLAERLIAAGKGKFAMIGAAPGSSSYRNAQRIGFTPVYSTLVMFRSRS